MVRSVLNYLCNYIDAVFSCKWFQVTTMLLYIIYTYNFFKHGNLKINPNITTESYQVPTIQRAIFARQRNSHHSLALDHHRFYGPWIETGPKAQMKDVP